MVKRVVTAVVTVCAGMALGVLLAVAGHSGTADAAPVSDIQPPADSSSAVQQGWEVTQSAPASSSTADGYYIKDYRGRVAVLRDGSDVPEMIFDIYTKMLPDVDRQQLGEGIYVSSYEEMLRMVEDYIS